MTTDAWSRRQFIGRAAALAALTQVPGLLKARGWWEPAFGQEADVVLDTLNGLVAFILPGDDAYSVAQGEKANGPGAVAAGTAAAFRDALDDFLPQPDQPVPNDDTVPLSGAVANLFNVVALTVNPAAANGQFLSPFARLGFADKAKVFETLEADNGAPDDVLPQPFTKASGNFRFVAGIIPGFVAFLAGSEQQKFDPKTKTLTGRPVAWNLAGYLPDGPVNGTDDFKGYYGGRRSVTK